MDKRDAVFFCGLALGGVGLFFWVGLGPALAIPGAVLTLVGVFMSSGRRGLS